MASDFTAKQARSSATDQAPAGAAAPISVLVVDDSAFMRKMVSEMVASEPTLLLQGTARDGEDALEQIDRLNPRVVTLDIEMPRLDGFGVLEALAKRALDTPPVSVVVLSSLTQRGAEATLRCLDMGAVDFVSKPSGAVSLDIASVRDDLLAKIKAAGHSRSVAALARRPDTHPPGWVHGAATSSSPILGRGVTVGRAAGVSPGIPEGRDNVHLGLPSHSGPTRGILVIGASTGGPRALQELFASLDPERIDVPIVIVQHMPPRFTASLAQHLQGVVKPGLVIREAQAGDALEVGRALLAPGGKHLVFTTDGRVRLSDEPPIHGVRPAVDVTLMSLAAMFKNRTYGVLLTGMGRDGARGMKLVRDLGGHTLAEDESSCVVFGMPKAAWELGGVERLVELPAMADAIMRMLEASYGREKAA